MVEYAVILGAVTLVGLGAFALLGHKSNDLVATITALLPGAHNDDNGAVFSGELVSTTNTGNGIGLTGTPGSMSGNLGVSNAGDVLVTDGSSGSGS
jgi:Flp pilus assembly pilin Flp